MSETAAMNETVLSCQGLGMTMPRASCAPVFDGLDLAIAKGETVAILGASGAGKSTLLHLLGGLDTPAGRGVRGWPEDERAVGHGAWHVAQHGPGFVYQFHHLLPEFTALENVMLPVLLNGRSVDEARGRAQRCSKRSALPSPGAQTGRIVRWRAPARCGGQGPGQPAGLCAGR